MAHASSGVMPLHLKAWREFSGLTLENVAAAVDKSVPTIQRWESGKRMPGADDIESYAGAIRRHPGDLFRSPDEVIGVTSLPIDAAIEAMLLVVEGVLKVNLRDEIRSDLAAEARKTLSRNTWVKPKT